MVSGINFVQNSQVHVHLYKVSLYYAVHSANIHPLCLEGGEEGSVAGTWLPVVDRGLIGDDTGLIGDDIGLTGGFSF